MIGVQEKKTRARCVIHAHPREEIELSVFRLRSTPFQPENYAGAPRVRCPGFARIVRICWETVSEEGLSPNASENCKAHFALVLPFAPRCIGFRR